MINLASLPEARANRFAVFKITQADLVLLDRHHDALLAVLPDILTISAEQVSIWQGVRDAMKAPEVAQVRTSHWTRVLTGELGDGYRESAAAFATTFLRHGIPGLWSLAQPGDGAARHPGAGRGQDRRRGMVSAPCRPARPSTPCTVP